MRTPASSRTPAIPSTPACRGTPRAACPPPPPAAPRPRPLVHPPGGARQRPVADHSSDTPSLVSGRVREPGPREAAPRAARRGVSLPRLPALPRPVLIALGTLVVAGLAYFVYG